jgi:hypothetical protein
MGEATQLTQTSAVYKTGVKRQGGVALQPPETLAEYVSRNCREKIVKAIYEEIRLRIGEQKNMQRRKGESPDRKFNVTRVMAHLLDVHIRTIQRWQSGGIQACDFNTERVLELGMKYCPDETEFYLQEDLSFHRQFFETIIYGVRQGGVALPPPRVVY